MSALSSDLPSTLELVRNRLHPQQWMDVKAAALAELRGSHLTRLPLWVFLDRILDPMNVGSILRSVFYFGAGRVVAATGAHPPLSAAVSKASAGVVEHFPLTVVPEAGRFLRECRIRGMDVIAAVSRDQAENSAPLLEEPRLDRPSLLVLGSESTGLAPELEAQVTKRICLTPGRNLPSGIDSLNVSVAAGILLHSTLSAWRRQPDTFYDLEEMDEAEEMAV